MAKPRQGLIAAGVLAGAALAWWLGSPLFIRTQLNEPPPIAAAAPVAQASALPTGTAAAPSPRGIKKGELQPVDALHYGRGTVGILETLDARILRFENVTISNAPDVQIYISKDTGGRYEPANAVHLGSLRATDGSFNYPIPAGLDLTPYRSVVVWCRAFNVLITWADLG